MRLPKTYVIVLAGLLLFASVLFLVYRGVPPFDTVAVFVTTSLSAVIVLMVFGIIGGAFVGMLLAHRLLAAREFSPFERSVLAGLDEVRENQRVTMERLTALEKRSERLDETRRAR
jgi:Na+/H+ antiporter NhaC